MIRFRCRGSFNGTGYGGGIGSGSGGGVGSGTDRELVGTRWRLRRRSAVGGGSAPKALLRARSGVLEEARKAKYRGTVVLWLVVDANGRRNRFSINAPWAWGWMRRHRAVKLWKFVLLGRASRARTINVEVNSGCTSPRLRRPAPFLSQSVGTALVLCALPVFARGNRSRARRRPPSKQKMTTATRRRQQRT